MTAYRELPEDGTIPDPVMTHDLPSRIWHWVTVLLMMALIYTGYIIGKGPVSVAGETGNMFTMGNLRFLHLVCGQIFAVLFVARIYWAISEGDYARQMFLPDFWHRYWLRGFVTQVKWNLLLLPRCPRYLGLNPLGATAVVLMFVLPAVVVIITGFAMMAEIMGRDSWQFHLFGWVMAIVPDTIDLHLYHRLCMWVMMWFFIIHVYIAVRDDIHSRQTLISSMLSGERQFRR